MSNESNENIECELRFGHCEGFTDCCFVTNDDNSSANIMTCGVDSEVRLWSIDSSDDHINSFPISDQSYAIVCNSKYFFIACDSNCVKSYSLSDGENETTVCRFTTNATHLDMSSDGSHLVASAADFTLKLINLETNSQRVFEGHDAPILSVSLDPKQRYIASSSCDSSVRIWSTEDQHCVQSWTNCFPKSNDFENSPILARICWEPINGETIAVPKVDRIEVYQRDTWDLVDSYRHEKLAQISIVTFSLDGLYLAAASNTGTVIIWETKLSNCQPIAKFFHNKNLKITSLKFNPKNSKQICFCDINGQFGILRINRNGKKGLELSGKEIEEMFKDLSDDEFDEDLNQIKEIRKTDEIDFELPKIELNPNLGKRVSKPIEESEGLDDNPDPISIDDEDNEFDIGAIKSRYESQIFGENNENLTNNEIRSGPVSRMSGVGTADQPKEPKPLRQKAFQPGSTPVHFKQRFMVWNSVGIVHSYNTEEDNSIDVEFHDVTYHHSIHIPNVQNYTIADLSCDSLVLATNGDENEKNGKLFCMLLNTWDATKEWQIEMPEEECIEALTCGSGFIAVATDKRFVRIFTTGGIQTNIFSIAGRILCMSAHEEFMLIIYHNSCGMPEEQSISMIILKVNHKLVAKHPIPNPTPVAVSPKSQVLWAGFSDEGTPCVVDYDGVVRLYKTINGNLWIPIAFTKEHIKSKSDNYFIIGLSEIQNQIRCIFCKGSRFPSTVPKPTLSLLSLRIPLCEMHNSKGKHEEEQIRNQLLGSLLKKLSRDGFEVDVPLEECNKNVINSLIKLFALALGADRESLALEIANLMPNQRAVEGAIKYAERQRHRSLAQKLSEIAEQKLEEELEDECEENDEHISSHTLTTLQSEQSNDLQLKPKSLRKVSHLIEDSNSRFQQSESDSDIESKAITTARNASENEDNSNDSVALKPKKVTKVNQKRGNPFKVNEVRVKQTNGKRRHSESENSDNQSDDEEIFDLGFDKFYQQMKNVIKDDNSDVEDEEELIKIAKNQFKSLDSDQRKSWLKSKKNKRNVRTDDSEKAKPNDNTNKITKFFRRS